MELEVSKALESERFRKIKRKKSVINQEHFLGDRNLKDAPPSALKTLR